MKRLFTMCLSVILTFVVASVSMASIISIDYCGNVDTLTNIEKQTAVGYDGQFENIKLGLNTSYGTGDSESSTNVIAKVGYMLINNDQFKVAATGGYYYRNYSIDNNAGIDETVDSILIGFDAKFRIANVSWIDFSYAHGLNPKDQIDRTSQSTTSSLDSLSSINCKLNYLFESGIGISVGYFDDEINDLSFNGVTLGAFYRY